MGAFHELLQKSVSVWLNVEFSDWVDKEVPRLTR